MDDFSKLIAPAKLADDNRIGHYYTAVIESADKQEQVISFLAISQDDAYERVMDAIAEGDDKVVQVKLSGIDEARKAWENQDIAKC